MVTEPGGADAVEPDGVASDADAPAFDAFAGRERSALVTLAWSLTGRLAVAEEIVQDALTAAWRSWDVVRGYDKPGAWARRVVINQASNHRRSTGREGRAYARMTGRRRDIELTLPEPDTELWDAVRALPERQAQVVALHYLEDRSVADVADVLDCAEGTVKAHLHKARLSLARALGLVDRGAATAERANQEVDQ